MPPAFAAPPAPGGAKPGQIEKQFREPPRPRATPAPVARPAPTPQARPANAEEIRFVLQKIGIDGTTVYQREALAARFDALLGKEVTLAQVYGLADQLTAQYRNDGYILSQVVVPEQNISLADGAVRLVAVEGFIDQVALDGDIAGRRALLDAYAERMKSSRPLHVHALERYLLLINDLGGTVARSTLAPSQKVAGASDLTVSLTHDKVSGNVGLNNRNTDTLGPWRINADADFHSVLGWYEHTGVRLATTANDELNFIALQHDEQIGKNGGKLGLSLSFAKAKPDPTAAFPVDIESNSDSAALTYSYPWTRTRARNLYLRTSLTFQNGESEFSGIPLSEDRTRALRLGLTYDVADRWRGVNIFDTEFSQGLDMFGATETGSANLSRADGHSDFRKLTLYLARLQSLSPSWSLLAAFNAQSAFNELLGSEQFAFGGEQFGRGYDASELLGDSGVAFKLEPRFTRARGGGWLQSYTAYAYYDIGKAWLRGAASNNAETAAAAGLGVRLTMAGGVSGFAELAKPLTREVQAEGNKDPRVFAGVSLRY